MYKGVRGGVQDVAVKMLHCGDSEDGLKQFVDECCILKSLNYDRNVVQFYGACLLSGRTPMLVRVARASEEMGLCFLQLPTRFPRLNCHQLQLLFVHMQLSARPSAPACICHAAPRHSRFWETTAVKLKPGMWGGTIFTRASPRGEVLEVKCFRPCVPCSISLLNFLTIFHRCWNSARAATCGRR